MAAISFTTDFGAHEWYVGVMKGVVHNVDPSATMIDITHEIKNHSIEQAAFVLAWSYSFFAPESIHVVIVDPGVGGMRPPILLKSRGHFFIGPDNGVFTLVDQPSSEVYLLDKKGYWLEHVSDTFHGRDIFAPIAAHLARGTPPHLLGSRRTEKPVAINLPKYSKEADGSLSAQIIHVDRFGNCMTNISSEVLPRVPLPQVAMIKLAAQEITGVVARMYEQVSSGQPMVLVGSSGFLELSLNKDRFSDRYHVGVGDTLHLRIANK